MDGTKYALLGAGVVVVGVAGFVGFLVYPQLGLGSAAGTGLLVLGAATGFAGFFSPCSFPLLASLLARRTGTEEPLGRRLRRALGFAASLSVGAVVFIGVIGALIGLGGQGVAASVTFTSVPGRILRVVVGVFLVTLGAVQAGWLDVNLRWAEPAIHRFLRRQAELRREHPVAATAVFGFGYLAAGFG